jgi:hypothetical protein
MTEIKPYWPVIEGGRISRVFRLGRYRAALVTGMSSPGSVQYLHVLFVFQEPEARLCLCVASEENSFPAESGGDSHYLGVFPGDGHLNLGASNDWANVELFTSRALDIAAENLAMPNGTWVEMPRKKKPWWRVW